MFVALGKSTSDPEAAKRVLVPASLHFLSPMSMKISALALSAAALAVTACEKTTAPDTPPTYRLTATVTASNNCSVSVMDKNYSSIGQIRGDVPTQFISTIPDKSYHGFGCWVATSDGDGDLIVLFSGNTYGKPLETGTYQLVRQVLDDTPLGKASVSFRPSFLGDKLRTMDNAAGTVVVEKDANGSIVIKVDADVVRWGEVF